MSSNSYFRPNAWRETNLYPCSEGMAFTFGWASRMLTLLLLFVEDVAGLEVFGCCPQDLCLFECVSGTSPTLQLRVLESQRSFANKTLYYYSAIQCVISFKYRLLHCISVKDTPRRGQWTHLFPPEPSDKQVCSPHNCHLIWFKNTLLYWASLVKYMILSKFSGRAKTKCIKEHLLPSQKKNSNI